MPAKEGDEWSCQAHTLPYRGWRSCVIGHSLSGLGTDLGTAPMFGRGPTTTLRCQIALRPASAHSSSMSPIRKPFKCLPSDRLRTCDRSHSVLKFFGPHRDEHLDDA